MKVFQNKTILVADDDSGNRELVLKTMEMVTASVEVLSASTGDQVLHIMNRRPVNAVLLDWEMPRKDGYEVLCEIRSKKEFFEIPVLMYTGVMTSSQNLLKALDAGADDFIRKPAEPLEIIARIRSALNRYDYLQARIHYEKEIARTKESLLNLEIERLRSEMNNALLLTAQKNEILQQLREKISGNEPAPQSIAWIDSKLGLDNHWEDIINTFRRTEPQFMTNLTGRFPDISNNEIRFCLLVRSGMQTKDIASLMNVTVSAVEKTRYRIRKKFALPSDENLERFIFQI